MNRRALNRAWVNKWKNANKGMLSPIAAIIMPSCLKVERAIIFFRSHSNMAVSPAIKVVKEAMRARVGLKILYVCRKG